MDFTRIVNAVIRAVKLDVSFYDEVKRDPGYNQDAITVVAIAAVAGGVGSFLSHLITGSFLGGIINLILLPIIGIIIYYLWAFLVHFVGTKLFKGSAGLGEVQRPLGFAWAPQALAFFTFVPLLGALLGFVGWLWTLVAGYVAVRQALGLDNTNTILTVVIAGIIAFVVYMILGLIITTLLVAIGLAGAGVLGAM